MFGNSLNIIEYAPVIAPLANFPPPILAIVSLGTAEEAIFSTVLSTSSSI
jgi:hypothetical protein